MRRTITMGEFAQPEYEHYKGRFWYQGREIDWIDTWYNNTGWERARTFALMMMDGSDVKVRREAELEIEA